MRRTKEEAAVTRQAVLNAALEVFSEKGYAATRLDDVAERAGITRGAIYWHFENKAALYETLVTEITGRMGVIISDTIDEGGTFSEVARRLLVRGLEFLEADREYRLVTELMMFKTAQIPELEDGLALKQASLTAVIDQITGLVEAGISAGDVRDDLKPREVATAFLALQNGLATTWLLCNRTFLLQDSARAAAEIFVRGIAR